MIAGTPLPRLVYCSLRLWQRLARPLSVGAQALVIDGDGRVLLIHHAYIDGWHLPGGRVANGETAAEGAVRELREETGLIATSSPRLLGFYGRFGHGGSDHIAVYVITGWVGTLEVDGLEVDDASFYSYNDLPAGTAAPVRRRLAENWGAGATADRW